MGESETATVRSAAAIPVGTPGLVWAFELGPGAARSIERCDSRAPGFHWYHVSLANHSTESWISQLDALPDDVKDLLLGHDNHQRAMVEDGVVACVLHDFERDFEEAEHPQVGVLRFALTPTMMITARLHPLRSADVFRHKIAHSEGIEGPADALDLLIRSVTEGLVADVRKLGAAVQHAEDAFLDEKAPPTARGLIEIRRRHARVHRMLDGLREVFRRLESDEDMPEELVTTVERLGQRVQSLGADSLGVQRQILQLREEIDIQNDQRTNQNLYMISIMTTLMLPATFITGLFGMNTGGLPWSTSPSGTLWATMLAFGTAGATYLLLRRLGLMRR
jgi:Mg2+ and Co2+ transporter CorA